MKKEIRIIGWDDCAFGFKQKYVTIVGTVFRGASFLDGLLSTHIEKDGMDATENIANAILNSRHYDQLSYIMLDGITLGGFNVVDIKKIFEGTDLPVIVALRKMPEMKKFLAALEKLPNYGKRTKAVKAAGKFFMFRDLIYQKTGLSKNECEDLLRLTCVRSIVPEPLRIAHLIASGLSGESRGRA